MKEQQNLVQGYVHVIPNPTRKLGDYAPTCIKEGIKSFLETALGRQIDDNERVVQVWFSDHPCPDKEDNWSCHGCPQAGIDMDGIRHNQCEGFLPLAEVKELKEGDILHLTLNGHKAAVIAYQGGQYPHASGKDGRFENVIDYLRNYTRL